MLAELQDATGVDFEVSASQYRAFTANAQNSVQESDFYLALLDIFQKLSGEFVVGKVRAVDAWAGGESEFRLVTKSWESVVDKLYRLNIEENGQFSSPPYVKTIRERAQRSEHPANQRWITPNLVGDYADDLVRTKFVVPFVDGVVDVSERITRAIDDCGLPRFRRYHAKDSGYHARHHYILLPVPGFEGGASTIALEVKVLTKMQDMLGELTHLLYEQKRIGRIATEEKRKLAWLFDSPDFLASYVGHSAHLIEAIMVELKKKIQGLEG